MKEERQDKLNSSRIIPIFDCDYDLFDKHLEFYTAMGFKITYYQKSPYRFASVLSDRIGEFSFYGVKNHSENGNIGGCYVCSVNVNDDFNELKSNLKSYYGKIPSKGMPRFSRLNKTAEDVRFNITDLCGNTIIVGESLGESQTLMDEEEKRVKSLKSDFEKLYNKAYRFAYSKEDFLAARNTIEVAFYNLKEDISKELLLKAKVLQIEIFDSLGQKEEAKRIIKEVEKLGFTSDERENLKEFFERMDELKKELE